MSSRKLTYEDFLAIPYDGMRHEIIDGVHYVQPANYTTYQAAIAHLKSLLRRFPRFFYRPPGSRTAMMGTNNHSGVPALLVEFLGGFAVNLTSPMSLDECERLGVIEYWIVDPDKQSVEVYRHDGSKFVRSDIGGTLTSPLLPGFTLLVRKLFE